jgi:hypothetical protein
MENTANLGLFKNIKLSQNRQKGSMRTWRRHQKTQNCVQYISVNNNTNFNFFSGFFLSTLHIWDGLILKTISRYCPFKYTYKVYNDTAYKLKFARDEVNE